jgi:hypothetical protein
VYLSSFGIILSVKVAKRVNVKFLTKSATETYSLLMSVCLILMFSNSSKDLKKRGERSKMTRIPVGLAHQKQMPTLKRLAKLFEEIIA